MVWGANCCRDRDRHPPTSVVDGNACLPECGGTNALRPVSLAYKRPSRFRMVHHSPACRSLSCALAAPAGQHNRPIQVQNTRCMYTRLASGSIAVSDSGENLISVAQRLGEDTALGLARVITRRRTRKSLEEFSYEQV